MKYIFLLVLSCLCFFGCQSEKSQAYQNIATDLCACMQPLMDMNIKVQAFIKAGKNSEAERLLPQIQNLSTTGLECAKELGEKHGPSKKLNFSTLKEELHKQCPATTELLEQSGLFAEE